MTAQFLEFPDRQAVALVLPDPGRRTLRMLFRYGDDFRVMCWVKIGADGSLYLNHTVEMSEKLTHVKAIADGKGGWTTAGDVRDVNLSEIDEPNPKISQHASGVVRRATMRSTSVSFRNLTHLTLIRQDDYMHPSRYRIVPPGALRIADIVVPKYSGDIFMLDEARPLTSRLFVSPLRDGNASMSPVDEEEVDSQTSVVIPATGLKGCSDLTFQLVFWNHPPRSWPTSAISGILDADQDPSFDPNWGYGFSCSTRQTATISTRLANSTKSLGLQVYSGSSAASAVAAIRRSNARRPRAFRPATVTAA